MATTKNNMALSLPKAQKVRGYTIERMPLGRFLSAVQLIQDAPEDILKQLFPGAKAGGVLAQFSKLNRDSLQALFLRAAGVLPGYVVRLFAQMSGIEEEQLLTDPAVGLDGLAELFAAWMEVNAIENFINAAGALWVKVRNLATAGTGSKS